MSKSKIAKVRLTEEFHKAFKEACIENGKTVSSVLNDAIILYLTTGWTYKGKDFKPYK